MSQNNYLSKREVYISLIKEIAAEQKRLKITTSQRERFISILWHMGHVVEASQNNYLSKREVYVYSQTLVGCDLPERLKITTSQRERFINKH